MYRKYFVSVILLAVCLFSTTIFIQLLQRIIGMNKIVIL